MCGLKPSGGFANARTKASHPSWVCGLKLLVAGGISGLGKSHPSWVCGLKPIVEEIGALRVCHTLRGCVD